MDIKKLLAIGIGKFLNFILSFASSGGTAAPGLIALKIDKNLLKKQVEDLKYSIAITGTNGKTTTARMLASILKQEGIEFIHNRTGSNLLRGVVSQLIKEKHDNKIGLWEIDEAVFPLALKELNPKIVVLNNLFRDQLDRYGEIDTLAKKWKKGLEKLNGKAFVIANADDPTIVGICNKLKQKVIYYGIEDLSLGSKKVSHASDANVCPYCLENLDYEACFVSHLGIYTCPKCGKIQPKKDIKCVGYKSNNVNNNEVRIVDRGKEIKVRLNIPGIYNIYNVLASFAVARNLGIDKRDIINGFKKFRPAFGRFEKIKIDGKNLYILLVKNPTGYNQVLKTLPAIAKNKNCSCLLVLNDLIADGRDVSWIWDVDFNLLKNVNIDRLLFSGIRAEELALRIKYAMTNGSHYAKAPRDKQWSMVNGQWLMINDIEEAVNTLIKQSNENLFILPTYTAMLEVRKILARKGFVHGTWED